jgi:hypothetical protein
MEKKTGVRSLYAKFFRGYGAEIRLFRPDFRTNWTYKPNSMPRQWAASSSSGSEPPDDPTDPGEDGCLFL